MGQLGTYLLLFGLAVSGYGLLAAAVGAKTGRPALVESARRCAFGLFAIVAAANATMLAALLTNDFAIRYVAGNSALETPAFFKALSLWAVQPPILYLGFIAFAVPFAFGIAALLAGQGSDQWVSVIRRWTLVVWCFLTVGLLLGALWSYSVLGWGGYWAWDPVENVALLPWLTSTAFLHSVMLQERRGRARLWNIALV